MSDIFISYAREDAPIAEAIASKLRSTGFSVFIDKEVLVTGETFADAIQNEVLSARLVVLVLSRNARRSRWVQQELIAALEGGGSREVLPVLIDDEAEENVLWPLVANRQAIREIDISKLPDLVTNLARRLLNLDEPYAGSPARAGKRSVAIAATLGAVVSVLVGSLVFWQTPDKPPNTVELTPTQGTTPKPLLPTSQASAPSLPGQLASCRLPEHGVEDWKSKQQLVIDSGWIKGGSSPGEFCSARKAELQQRSGNHEIEIKSMGERHKSEYTPFKHDFYWYTCVIEDKAEPIYKLAPNTACPVSK